MLNVRSARRNPALNIDRPAPTPDASSRHAAIDCYTSAVASPPRIVLTGGPCGGKTTLMKAMRQEMADAGYTVLAVPEAATLLLAGGVSLVYPADSHEHSLAQARLIATMHKLEGLFTDAAEQVERLGGRPVILCDRGILDNKAYSDPFAWKGILDHSELTEPEALARYDLVVHMQSAAIGAEQHYNLESNAVRTETTSEAADLDRRLADAWRNHKNVVMVTNHGQSFTDKIDEAVALVFNYVEAGDIHGAAERLAA